MSFATISTLKTQLNKGARANLFQIELTFPTPVISAVSGNQTAFSTNMGLLCKSAAVPGFTIGVIEVPFRAGRRIKIAGDRTFADWTVTILNDENHTMRNAFNAWVNYVSTSNYDSTSKSTATDYYSTYLLTVQIHCQNLQLISNITIYKQVIRTKRLRLMQI